MGAFTKIPADAFDALQLEAGILTKEFDPAHPTAPDISKIICATTGGITATAAPSYSDFAEDVDNAPNNLMEFKHLDGWDCTLAFTSLGTSAELIRYALGAADVDATSGKITPRRSLNVAKDFSDLWWIGDKANGGFVAVRLINALSTEGFSLQTEKSGKGQISVTLTGHVSIDAQDVVPMEFYTSDAPVEEESE